MSARRNPGAPDEPASFVSRWSRRKHQARTAQAIDSPVPPVDVDPPGTELPVAEAGTPAGPSPATAEPDPIPDLDSLNEQSDYKRFMQADVSAELRRLALRKMFKAPVFGIRDGLDDYDEDFTTFESLGNVVTADMKFHQERLEKLAAQESPEPENASTPPAPNETVAAKQTVAQTEPGPAKPGSAESEAEPPRSDVAPAPAARAALVTVPLKPADPLEPPPPVLAADRSGLSVRAIADEPTADPKES